MRYFKKNDEQDTLLRLDKAESNVSSGQEIHQVEFDLLMLGVQIYIGDGDADKLIQKYKEDNGIG